MKGLELSRLYYEQVGRPVLAERFPGLFRRMAIGLAGEGSECLGFDDELSQDHDWGPSFCIWLTQEDFQACGAEVQEAYNGLPSLDGFPPRNVTPQGQGRVGVLSIPDWYRKYTGRPDGPRTLTQWRRVPESFLATATNGKVFSDPLGAFSSVRRRLLAFYPEDVRLKKIAARAAAMAQAGQYNYPRCIWRGEKTAAQLALAEFTRAGMSMVYLLNRCYAPFYKWMHRGLRGLPVLPRAYELFRELTETEEPAQVQERIEGLCRLIAAELRRQGLSKCGDSFLQLHCGEIMGHIKDSKLRNSHVLEE